MDEFSPFELVGLPLHCISSIIDSVYRILRGVSQLEKKMFLLRADYIDSLVYSEQHTKAMC